MSKPESVIGQEILIEASKHGIKLWRNNSGALKDAEGRIVRFGLGNESKSINDVIKSSDYIGITPIIITKDMVGQRVGIFTAIETKTESAKFGKREEAQGAFLDFVRLKGGFAGFARSVAEFLKIVGK